MKRNGALKFVYGIFLIAVGVLILLRNYLNINIWDLLWPMFMVIPGLGFEIEYFSERKNPGVLVPGGVLTFIGLFMYVNVFTNFRYMDMLWPFFMLAPAIGLFQLYYFGTKEKGLLVPVSILSFLTLIFLAVNFSTVEIGSLIIAAVLIIAGLFIMFRTIRGGKN
ncbi:MAG: hypothetical protein H7A31_01675 [Thermotogae bacterium]|nr:hypothetical protein [Thermotogota bacterium]HOO74846.1 DUF5668 domain-containing protein [Tepiditoga sp.]